MAFNKDRGDAPMREKGHDPQKKESLRILWQREQQRDRLQGRKQAQEIRI